jgi:hypothetical protein
LNGCSENDEKNNSISIQWKETKATGILIPRNFLNSIPEDSIELFLKIHLAKSNSSILGEYIVTDDAVIFHPLLPLTRGLEYEVYLKNKLLGEVEVPTDDSKNAPTVLAIYPTADTLPENLLKIYIEFSKPMQEGEALNHVMLIKNSNDTLSSVFLDLQPELWNNDRTILTLWLDPGRIKRDLQPNKKLGLPLVKGFKYQLLINKDWQDADGAELENLYRKDFVAGIRDSISPDPAKWNIDVPETGSKQSLKIYLHESLDYILLKNTVRIVDDNGHALAGVIDVSAKESILYFTPSVAWKTGNYTIEVESRLEDFAGNNLNRLFDNDLTKQGQALEQKVFKKQFHVR